MECSHARLLLLFSGPGPSELAAEDNAALQLHLEDCPECRARARTEHLTDAALSVAMRKVPVPSDLEGRILSRLKRERRPKPWPWVAGAAVLLLATGAFGVWYYRPITPVLDYSFFYQGERNNKSEFVETWFRNQDVSMRLPSQFEFDPEYLQAWDVVSLKGKRVAMLLYVNSGERPQDNAVTQVYVFPKNAFRLDEGLAHGASMVLDTQGEFIFLSKIIQGAPGAFRNRRQG